MVRRRGGRVGSRDDPEQSAKDIGLATGRAHGQKLALESRCKYSLYLWYDQSPRTPPRLAVRNDANKGTSFAGIAAIAAPDILVGLAQELLKQYVQSSLRMMDNSTAGLHFAVDFDYKSFRRTIDWHEAEHQSVVVGRWKG